MATNVNAEALKESPIPEAVAPKESKQTVDPYNVSHSLRRLAAIQHNEFNLTQFHMTGVR